MENELKNKYKIFIVENETNEKDGFRESSKNGIGVAFEFLDVNECDPDCTICGSGRGTCVNEVNHGFDCSCFQGYAKHYNWQDGTVSCEDIDECDTLEDACPGAFDHCLNEVGSFSCPCNSAGFHREQTSGDCQDVDECTMECLDELEVCQNEIGSYVCSCLPGYERNNDNGTCANIDQCISEVDKCPGQNDSCQNEVGGFKCICDSGYQRMTVESQCSDVDECESLENACPGPFDSCLNEVGNFKCICEVGFERLAEGANCSDVDECEQDDNICGDTSVARCENSEGSYLCG